MDVWGGAGGVQAEDGAGGAHIWIVDMGDEPPDWTHTGGFPPQVVPPAGRDETTAQYRGDMGVSTIVRGNVVGGPGGG